MKKLFSLFILFFITYTTNATTIDTITYQQNSDSMVTKYKWLQSPYWKSSLYNLDSATRRKRTRWVAGGNIAAYGGALAGLYTFWYSNYPQSSFHFYNDNGENLQLDKVSHAFGAYVEGKLCMEMWKYAGVSNRKAVLIGGLSGLAYEAIIETLDGFSSQWGWSWGDIGGNFTGTSILIAQELAWKEQRIQFKYSTHINSYKENYYSDSVRTFADKHFGTSFMQRLLEDYNTETYWLSCNLHSFFPKSNIPKWFNVAVGYGVEGIFGSAENYPEAKYIPRYRQWYLAPDIDLSRIKTKSRLLNYLLIGLNSFKFPTPSLEYSQGSFKFNWLHF